MTHKKFEQALAVKLGITSDEVVNSLQEMSEVMCGEFIQENNLMVSGFGSFEVKKRKERITRHPSTGQRILIPPKLSLSFQPSKNLKELVKGVPEAVTE